MRRLQSTNLPGFLSNGESPPQLTGGTGPWRASFELRSITPILGGGVHSFEPDKVDFVRVPAIRGQLRWWWRGLFQKPDEQPDTLFAQEARLWGGVGVPGHGREGDKEPPGLRSRVRITVEVLEHGAVKPAGIHKWGDRQLKAAPYWTDGQKLGYALFPLQRPQKEREKFEQEQLRSSRREEMPTRLLHTGLNFRLHVSLASPEPKEVAEVLASIWAWIYFGGLGARTRRGFGALELKKLDLPENDRKVWSGLFQGPVRPVDSEVLSWLMGLEPVASPCGALWPFEIILGRPSRQAPRIHEEMVGYLKSFRQDTGFARDPGQRGPGESRWPEPDLVRVLTPVDGPRFAHEPSAETVELVKAGLVGAPRAAFGLPIQIQFKDERDKRANATLLPPEAKRWPSPLLLRPISCANGEYLAAAILLPISPPDQVELEFGTKPGEEEGKKEKKVCRVASSAGAQFDIAKLLKSTKGNALEAFANWLQTTKGFKRISPPRRGGSHA